MLMIEMLARMPDLRRRIQAEHIADAGGRCRDCPGAAWPCELYRMATEADRRHGPGPGTAAPLAPGRRTPPAARTARAPGSDPRAVDRGPRAAGPDARALEREAWIAERGGPPPLGRGLPRQVQPGTVPVPAAPVWMSGPPARLSPVPPAPGSRWRGSAGPAGVGARLGGPAEAPEGVPGHALSGHNDLPAPRTTIGAFPAVAQAYGTHPASSDRPGTDQPTALSVRHDELRARREEHLARRDERRGRREDGVRQGNGGRHNLGWPTEEPVAGAPSGRLPRPHGELIDVLAEVLRY